MKPKPFVALNHFTVPVAISFSPWQFYELHNRVSPSARCCGPRQLKNWDQLVGVVRRHRGLGRQGMAKFVVVRPHIMSNVGESRLVALRARATTRVTS